MPLDGRWFRHPDAELFVTTSVGPRILHLARPGGDNLFHTEPPSGDGWQLYGGHRFWTAPEDELTYALDDGPVEVEGDRFSFVSDGLRRTLAVAWPHITHRLENVGPVPIRRACWALSVMAGGRAWLPRPALRPHPKALLPDRSLALWPYTDPSDPRWTWGRGAVRLACKGGGPQKIGAWNPLGWLAWQRGSTLFVKHTHLPAGDYPDRGSSHELFTSGPMLELESLGPLTTLAPGEAVELVERWWLVEVEPELSDAALGDHIAELGLDPGGL